MTEPKFEDDFDCDSEPPEQLKYNPTLYDIASVKAHNYAQEYEKTTGVVRDKHNYHSLREGYMAGFLDGFSHRFTTND